MAKWQLQDAKARFSELIDKTVKNGPQIVTKRGVDTAVVVSIDEWQRVRRGSVPNLKDILLGPGPRDVLVPKRGGVKSRSIPVLE